MFNTKAALFGVLVLFGVSGIATSPALALGPYWHVNGSKLGQGTKQIKLQSKGAAVFKWEDHVPLGNTITIECKNNISEGATIEGNGSKQGQGKGRIRFTQCSSAAEPSCKVAEPMTTNQLKGYLATYESSDDQLKYAYVFTPAQGNVLMTITVTGCSNTGFNVTGAAVTGSVAAAILPAEAEGQEGLLTAPELSITSVFHEQAQEGITLSFPKPSFSMRFTFGARLASGEGFGVFGQ